MKKRLFLIGMFSFVVLLNSIVMAQELSDFSVVLNETGDGAVITGYRGRTANIVIPSEIEGFPVKEIASGAFSGNNVIRDVVIPDSVQVIGDSAFGNSSVTALTIPASVKNLRSMMIGYQSGMYFIYPPQNLTKITFTGSRTSLPPEIFDSFRRDDWSYLSTVILPEGLLKIDNGTFSGLRVLKTITIPDTVTEIGANAFDGCSALDAIEIPDAVTEIGEYAFQNCKSLTTIVIPNSVQKIGAYAFMDCENLTSATLPEGLTEISRSLFNRTSLESIVIPSSVETIGIYAFQDTELTEVTFPPTIKEILGGAFNNCQNLRTLVFPDSISSLFFGAFYNNADILTAFSNCDYLTLASQAKLKNLGYVDGQFNWIRNLPTDVDVMIQTVVANQDSPAGFWDLSGDANWSSGLNLQLWTMEEVEITRKDRRFRFEHQGDGWYIIKNNGYGVVDVEGGRNGNGIPLQVYESNYSNAQKFRFVEVGTGEFAIQTGIGEKWLHVSGGNYSNNGTGIVIWEGEGGTNTKWRIWTMSSDNKMTIWTRR